MGVRSRFALTILTLSITACGGGGDNDDSVSIGSGAGDGALLNEPSPATDGSLGGEPDGGPADEAGPTDASESGTGDESGDLAAGASAADIDTSSTDETLDGPASEADDADPAEADGPLSLTGGSGETSIESDTVARAQILVEEGGATPDAPGYTLVNLFAPVVTASGNMIFTATARSAPTDGPEESFGGLWFGPMDSPRLISRDNGAVGQFRAQGGFTNDVADDGQSFGYKVVSPPSETALPVQGHAIASIDGIRVAVRTGDTVLEHGESAALTVLNEARHSSDAIVFTGHAESVGPGGMWLKRGEVTETVFDDRTVLANGCSVRLATRGTFELSGNDGVVFEASTTGAVGCNPDPILRYTNGTSETIVATGLPVPGAPGIEFFAPKLLDVLPDGTAVVEARLREGSDRARAFSYWLFPKTGASRLIGVQGESFAGFDDSGEPDNASISGGFLDVNDAGQVALSFIEGGQGGVILAAAGEPHPDQPYPDLLTPGASPLVFLARKLRRGDGVAPTPPAFTWLTKPRINSLGTVLMLTGSHGVRPDTVRVYAPSGEERPILGLQDRVASVMGPRPVVGLGGGFGMGELGGGDKLSAITDRDVVVLFLDLDPGPETPPGTGGSQAIVKIPLER